MLPAHLLARIPLFSGFPLEELDHVLDSLDEVRLKAGEFLFFEGDVSEHLFVVVSGKLDIIIGLNTLAESTVNTLTEGDSLGEFSLFISNGTRTASARAQTDVVLLRMHRNQFIQLLQHHPEAALATYRDLAITNRRLQQVVIEKELLEHELRIAAEIQTSILPDVLPVHERFDFGGHILPARLVGGDFYDVFSLDHNRLGVLIGDVADKGIPSAIFMARVHALIVSQAEIFQSPGDVLQSVNRYITRLDKSAQFVTALYGVLNTETSEFSYARAGHEPPLLLHPNGEVQRLSYRPGMALGLDEHIVLDEHCVSLSSGDLLVMFTDGLTDCRNLKREPFALQGITNTLTNLKDHTAQTACDQLFETLMNYQNGAKQDDDVTLVAVHAK